MTPGLANSDGQGYDSTPFTEERVSPSDAASAGDHGTSFTRRRWAVVMPRRFHDSI